MSNAFSLDPRLAEASLPLGRLSLCAVRLMNDSRFPWLLLVPQRPGLVEIHDLPTEALALLVGEISAASQALARGTAADKVNVGALGNLVPQLHVHVIARFRADAAWPGPVWGVGTPRPYEGPAELARRNALSAQLYASLSLAP